MNKYYAYMRVSTKKQGEGVSLTEQRSAIAAYAAQHSLSVVDWFEEKETAAHTGRPEFNRLVKQLRAGQAQGVILHKLDRGTRNYRDWADIGDLCDMGVDVRIAVESLDLRTRSGRLSADIHVVFAVDYIRNLRQEIKKGVDGCLKLGLYPLPAPVGYLNRGKGKPKEIDPVKGPLVRLAFEMYATGGYSLQTLLREMHTRGLRNTNGNAMSTTGMSWMLNNPFYAGVILMKRSKETFTGIHVPLISMALFQAVQRLLRLRVRRGPATLQHSYTKLIRCSSCRYHLVAEVQKRHTYYRCRSLTCKKVCVREEVISSMLADVCAPLTALGRGAGYVLIRAQEIVRQDAAVVLARRENLTLQSSALAQRLARLTDALLDGLIDQSTFTARKSEVIAKQAEVNSQLAALDRDHELIPQRLAAFLDLIQKPQAVFAGASTDDKRELVSILTANRLASPGNVEITLAEPFRTFANWSSTLTGAPHRKTLRTEQLARKLVDWAKTDTNDYVWLHKSERLHLPAA